MADGMSVDELGGMPLLSVRDVALRGWKLSLKRGLDIIGGAIGLILLAPLLLVTWPFYKIQTQGRGFFSPKTPVLYCHPLPTTHIPTNPPAPSLTRPPA